MKTREYQAYKKHILNYMTVDELKDNLECRTPKQLIRDGFFNCYFSQVLDTLKEVYGDEYKPETYFNKDETLKYRAGEAYCWTVYVNKMALTIEKLIKEQEKLSK